MQRDMTEMILRFLSDIFIEASRAKDCKGVEAVGLTKTSTARRVLAKSLIRRQAGSALLIQQTVDNFLPIFLTSGSHIYLTDDFSF